MPWRALPLSKFSRPLIYNQAVRFFLAILQLLLLSLPTFASTFSSIGILHGDAESNLPACCRRNGAHHCGMTPSQRASTLEASGVSAKPQPCPFSPKALPAAQHAPASLMSSAMIFAQVVSHPACVAQTLAKRRIAQDRSRQKRGPPALA